MYFANTVIPMLNTWQGVTVTEKDDGVDGAIKWCIMSEQGKIPLNDIYDFQEHKFFGEKNEKDKKDEQDNKTKNQDASGAQIPKKTDINWRAVMEDLCTRLEGQLSKQSGAQGLFTALESFLKKRTQPLRDVTELLTISEFGVFRDATFFEPGFVQVSGSGGSGPGPVAGTLSGPLLNQLSSNSSGDKNLLFLTDIFTVTSSSASQGSGIVDPLFLSSSLRLLYDLKWQLPSEDAARKKMLDGIVQAYGNISSSEGSWKKQWDEQFKPLYGKELQSLPNYIESLLCTGFLPQTFSILVEGVVSGVMQRALVFVFRYPLVKGDSKKGIQGRYNVVIEKLCWL